MSHSQSVSTTVDKARAEVNALKATLSTIYPAASTATGTTSVGSAPSGSVATSALGGTVMPAPSMATGPINTPVASTTAVAGATHPATAAAAAGAPPGFVSASSALVKHVSQIDTMVEKAEAALKRIKYVGRVPPRPTASVPPPVRAHRALSVLSEAVQPRPRLPTPLREDRLLAVLRRISAETELGARRVPNSAVGFECRNLFRAFLWFRARDEALYPEHIACFRVDELTASRWTVSNHAVFNVFTERANAALRYFHAVQPSGEEALFALALWLARHKRLFSDRPDDRRLAFDASRGIFLPACVAAFDANVVRFTRGTIPVRHASAQPTVRVPLAKNHSTSHQ